MLDVSLTWSSSGEWCPERVATWSKSHDIIRLDASIRLRAILLTSYHAAVHPANLNAYIITNIRTRGTDKPRSCTGPQVVATRDGGEGSNMCPNSVSLANSRDIVSRTVCFSQVHQCRQATSLASTNVTARCSTTQPRCVRICIRIRICTYLPDHSSLALVRVKARVGMPVGSVGRSHVGSAAGRPQRLWLYDRLGGATAR